MARSTICCLYFCGSVGACKEVRFVVGAWQEVRFVASSFVVLWGHGRKYDLLPLVVVVV